MFALRNRFLGTFFQISSFIKKSFSCRQAECLLLPEKKGLILGVYEGQNNEPVLTQAACKYNEKMQGKLMELIIGSGDCMKQGQARAFNNISDDFWSIAVAGLGKQNQGYHELEAIDMNRESVRSAAGLGAQLLHQQQVGHIFVEGLGLPEQAAEGSALAIWRYQDNKNKEARLPVPTLELYENADHDSWQRGLFKAEAQNVSRLLCDTPPNQMTPTAFAQNSVNILCPCGIKVDIHDKDWIENKKLKAFLAVARGSCEPPCFIEANYCGGPPDQDPIVLIGNGITFDSGGLCLKSCRGMRLHRAEMCGAACVVAIIRAASMLSLPLNVTGVLPLCENMPSGMAFKCGDVFQALNGTYMEVEDTNNEGRLILADAVSYVQKYLNPRLIIDIGTMSSDTRKTLGCGANCCFSNSEIMWKQLRKAGIVTGDRCWRFPLWKYYKRRICDDYTYVDTNNVGEGKGTPCKTAAFINQFIKCVDWIHMDISGTGKISESKAISYLTEKRMMGRPVRTIVQLLYQLACPNPCDRPL